MTAENKTGLVRRFCVRIAVRRLLCVFTHSIQRADPTVQVDDVRVVEPDMKASKTDNRFRLSPRGTACCRTRTGLFGSADEQQLIADGE